METLMTTTVDAGLDLRSLYPGSRGRVAAILSAVASAGPAALYSVAARFLECDRIRVGELDHLSDSNLSMLTLAIQEGAPELVESWHVILAELVGP